jgi:uncharacterized protein
VHISELADRFVKDPHEVVKAGDVVRVRVKEVDVARKRIALTMKSGPIDQAAPNNARPASAPQGARGGSAAPKGPETPAESAFAAALRRAQERK